jgi:DNA-binding transcriptional LysR family regulator
VELHHVRYFVAVIDNGSISAAASALGVAQPSISQALRTLERELRIPLFHRVGRGMVATSAGRALIGPARWILRDITVAERTVRDAEGDLRGRLEIRSHPAVSCGTLPRLVAEFLRRNPKVTVEIGAMHDESAVAGSIHNAVCEIAVTHLPVDLSIDAAESDRVLDVFELGAQEFWIVYPPGADIPDHDPLPWAELDTPLVATPRGALAADEITRILPSAQAARRPAAILENREARLAFALAGVGAALIERSMVGVAQASGAPTRAFTPPLTQPYGLVFDRNNLSPAAAAFLDLARTQMAEESCSATARNASAAGES